MPIIELASKCYFVHRLLCYSRGQGCSVLFSCYGLIIKVVHGPGCLAATTAYSTDSLLIWTCTPLYQNNTHMYRLDAGLDGLLALGPRYSVYHTRFAVVMNHHSPETNTASATWSKPDLLSYKSILSYTRVT